MTTAREPLWIGVDDGGTKVLAGVVDETGHVSRTARRATPGRRVDIAQVEDAPEAAVLEVADGAPIAAGACRNAMQRSLVGAAHRAVPPIVSALLGPDAGLVGAAELARRAGDQPRR